MKTEYYVFLHVPGPNWVKDKPIHEQPLDGHFAYMSHLVSEEKLVVGGGFLDGTGAMGVLRCASLEEATEIVRQDPAVRDEIVTSEVHAWFVTVPGTIRASGEGEER